MPQLSFKGLKESEVQQLSKKLSPKLSQLMNTPEDWFTFEFSPVTAFVSGEKVEGEPCVDVRWFDRGQEVQDETATIICGILTEMGYKETTVVFSPLKKQNFYENGVHY